MAEGREGFRFLPQIILNPILSFGKSKCKLNRNCSCNSSNVLEMQDLDFAQI